jgi:simple sugar transport system permease protein
VGAFAQRSLGVLLPLLIAVAATMIIFGAFLAAQGVDPIQAYGIIWLGGFGTWFSWQDSLVRAAPLLLTGLCVALPAQMGLMIIGGEGAFVLGALGAVAVGLALASSGLPDVVVDIAMGIAGIGAGGALIAVCGILRFKRGVNETISSLLLAYISIAVMNQVIAGPMRDPASLNRPATRTLADNLMLGNIPGTTIHVGLIFGLVGCLAAYVCVYFTKFGFAARVVGGNARAGRVVGLPVERMIVAFLARMNPLAIIPFAILLGGLDAAGGLLQQRLNLPDATMLVFRGVLFVMLLASEAFQGRLTRYLVPRRRLAEVV